MIVIELEEKKYGKTMEAVSKIREYAECIEEMLADSSMGERMNYRGYNKYDEPYEHDMRGSRRTTGEYRGEFRGDYGSRYM